MVTEYVSLDKIPKEYVRSLMTWRPNAILDRLPADLLDHGEIIAALPERVMQSERLFMFDYGGMLTGEEIKESREMIMQIVLNHLQDNIKSVLVCLDFESNADDSWLISADANFFTFGSEVYFYVVHKHASESQIYNAILHASEYPFIGILTSVEDISAISTGRQVQHQIMDELARNMSHILVGTYDGDSMLVWTVDHQG